MNGEVVLTLADLTQLGDQQTAEYIVIRPTKTCAGIELKK